MGCKWGNEVAVPVSARGTILGYNRSRNKKPDKKKGRKMRGLGVRSPLRTEGAAWARAPGQCHRDRNVRNQIVSALFCHPITPNLAHLSRGPGHCTRVDARAPHSGAPVVSVQEWQVRGYGVHPSFLFPPSPNRKKEKKSPHENQPPPLVQPPPLTRTKTLVTCPW